jgi:hypothetical protein
MNKFYVLVFSKLRLRISFICFFIVSAAFAQVEFEQVLPLPPAPQSIPVFDGVSDGSIAFADVDGDNDLDVLITGNISNSQMISKLYLNLGNGQYEEASGTPYDDVRQSSIAFSDVDGNGTLDIMITGTNSSGQFISKLYTNDGLGNFSEVIGTPFQGVSSGSIAFADVDGNGTQDVLITGWDSGFQPISKLYTNNGAGNFTEISGTPFENVNFSSIAFSDIDGNGTQDVLITGRNGSSFQPISKLYVNDGAGNFTEVSGTPFDDVRNSSIAFSDVDGNGTQDVLITGLNSSNQPISKLYTNDGTGIFTEVSGTPFVGAYNGSLAFSDVDGNGTQDVIITGLVASNQNATKFYTNDGVGNFTEVAGTPFDDVNNSSIAFADVDGDNTQDVLITGSSTSNSNRVSKLYINDGIGNFTEISGTPFERVYNSSIAFSDVDGNSTQDVLITGYNSNQRISKLYTNDGAGNFTEVTGTPFDNVERGSIAFSDVDGNGTQDVLITGYSSNQPISKLYTNDGAGNFTEVTGTPFQGVWLSSVAFTDIDGNGTQDVLITGQNNSNQPISKLYTNDGAGNFTEVTGTPFDDVRYSSIAFTDIDGNGTQDVLITGQNNSFQRISKLYINDGAGNFTEVSGLPFVGVIDSSIAFIDVDGNDTQDVLITGYNSSNQTISILYTNDGTGNFTELSGLPFEGVRQGSIAFSDVDGNGSPDVLITGRNNSNQSISKLYANDGTGNFTEVTGTPFDGITLSSIAFKDVDGDNDPDVILTGVDKLGRAISVLYRNIPVGLRWTGTVNSDWNNPQNWSTATIPATDDDVLILDVSTTPEIGASQNIEINNLIVAANAKMHVSGILKVNQDINNGGEIIFRSDSNSIGQLDEFSGTISGIGEVLAERYIPQSNRAYRYLGSPVNTSGSINENMQEGVTTADVNPNPNPGYGTHITGGSTTDGFDTTETNNPSMFGWDVASQTWQAVTQTKPKSMNVGEAYALIIRGDRSTDLSSNESLGPATTLRFRGNLHNGNFVVLSSDLAQTVDEFSLIANPYQAKVDMKALLQSADAQGLDSQTIYVYDPTLGDKGGYATIDLSLTNPTSTPYNPSLSGSTNADENLQPHQAFFIRTTTSNPSLTFKENYKKTSGTFTDTFSEEETLSQIHINLKRQPDANLTDGVSLRFDNAYSTTVNDEDALKFWNYDERVAVLNNNAYLSIDKRPAPQALEEIQLYTANYQTTNYFWQIQLDNLNREVFLIDTYLDTEISLSANSITDINFDIDTNIAESIDPWRFKLRFGNETLSQSDFELNGISVYPNPVTAYKFTVSGLKSGKNTQVKIVDMLGRVVFQTETDSSEHLNIELDKTLSGGVYQLVLKQGKQTYQSKLILEN